MPADFHLHDATLNETLARLQDLIRNEPAVSGHRAFLFQLLAVLGQWQRAATQLDVLGGMEPGALAVARAYREAVHCEMLRAEIFAGSRTPLVFGEPEEWVALLLEALKQTAAGRFDRAGELRAAAFEKAPATAGTLVVDAPGAAADAAEAPGQPFEWIADADSRLGPMLEAVVNGRYYWIPFHRIRRIRTERPADLRDLVWLPAQFQWTNGGEAAGLVPARYPGSETAEQDDLRLARRTEWVEHPGETFLGLGQRMLATDRGEHAFLDVRRVDLG